MVWTRRRFDESKERPHAVEGGRKLITFRVPIRPAVLSIAALVAVLAFASIASAHVTVWPRESFRNASELYAVRVPSEKPIPTVRVRVEFPEGVVASRFVPAPGWQREVEKDANGRIVAATWSGGSIASDEIGLFQFSARNPDRIGPVAFKAYQTYADGSVVEWVNPGEPQPAAVVQLTDPTMTMAQLSQAANLSQVITAVWILDNSGLHDLDEAAAEGRIPAGSLGRVQRAQAITAATMWPTTLREDATKLTGHLQALHAAIEANDPAAAAHPAHEVHEVGHDLSGKAYAWLGAASSHAGGSEPSMESH
jgi:uncharacterized protein YcnI